jgi:AcrR family transcriptional regulator
MGTKHATETERRIQILEAARKVFLRRGYYDTRMDDIVRESRLSKGALYWYFKGKRDVFNAIYLQWFELIIAEMDNVISSDKSPIEKIYELGVLTVSFSTEEPESFRAMLELYVQAFDDKKSWRMLGSFYKDVTMRMEALIRDGIKRGELRRDIDVQSVSLFITQSLDVLDLIPLLGFREIDLKKHWQEVFRIIMEGISNEKRARPPGREK